MNDQSKASRILMDYYVGAYGATLRIDVDSRDALETLRDTFKALADGSKTEVVFSNGPDCRLTGFSFLRLETTVISEEKQLRTAKSAERDGLVWRLNRVGWADCVALVGGLFQLGHGHQYLTREGVDDALVELAYRERPGSVT